MFNVPECVYGSAAASDPSICGPESVSLVPDRLHPRLSSHQSCLEGRCDQRALRFWSWSGTGLLGMLLLALNFVGEMETVQAIRSEYQDSARCSGAGRLLPLPSTCSRHGTGSPTTEERHISSRTAASILYACKCSLSELLCACPTIDLNNPRRPQP